MFGVAFWPVPCFVARVQRMCGPSRVREVMFCWRHNPLYVSAARATWQKDMSRPPSSIFLFLSLSFALFVSERACCDAVYLCTTGQPYTAALGEASGFHIRTEQYTNSARRECRRCLVTRTLCAVYTTGHVPPKHYSTCCPYGIARRTWKSYHTAVQL